MKTVYQCEKCFQLHDCEEQAIICEKMHDFYQPEFHYKPGSMMPCEVVFKRPSFERVVLPKNVKENKTDAEYTYQLHLEEEPFF